jgi:hypothetical protein
MEKFYLEATKFTPEINLDPESRVVSLVGKSYPENTFDFYEPMINWLENYFETPSEDKTTVNLEIIYFNSSSSKLFFDFFDILEDAVSDGHSVEINWIYDEDNENAEEAGEDYQDDFQSLNFNLVKKESE